MTNVKVPVKNTNINEALRKLRKKCEREGVVSEMRKREAYVKPSDRRRLAIVCSKARRRKRETGSVLV